MVKIIVTRGPNLGREIELTNTPVRIGRGPQANLCLTDPALQGEAVVEVKNGVCQVTNLSRTAIYLGGQVFPAGQNRVWYDETELQPTADTSLRLSRSPLKSPGNDPHLSLWGVAAGAMLLCAGLLILMSGVPSPEPVPKWDAVAPLITSPNLPELLRETLREARQFELAAQWKIAAQKYREVRYYCERNEPTYADTPEQRQAFRKINAFAGAALSKCIEHQEN